MLLKLHALGRAVLAFHSSAGVAIGHGLLVSGFEVAETLPWPLGNVRDPAPDVSAGTTGPNHLVAGHKGSGPEHG